MSDCKSVGVVPRAIAEVLHVVKTRSIRKWELNVCNNFVNLRTEDLIVSRCRSKIHTM